MPGKSTQYLINSRVDYLAHFGQAWIAFNALYNAGGRTNTEIQRVMATCVGSNAEVEFKKSLTDLSVIDPYIEDQVDSLRTCTCAGANNQQYTYSHDTTGFKFRLASTAENDEIRFFRACSHLPVLKPYCDGLAFFQPTSERDPLFRRLYRAYKSHMATSAQIVNSYNAGDISAHLSAIGIERHGRLLFHNLTATKGAQSIYTLEQVLGKPYAQRVAKIRTLRSMKAAGKISLDAQYRARGLSLFERFLLVMYQFRSAYFHGDLMPNSAKVQEAARLAHSCLTTLIKAI